MRDTTLSPPIVIDYAVSSDAQILRGQFYEIFDADEFSATLGAPIERLNVRLRDAAEEASTPNWDGYGSAPADGAAVEYARVLIPMLPRSYESPEIDIDPDGEVSFEWQTAARNIFSFSIGPFGRLSYAGLIGHRSFYGTEFFVDELPSAILEGLRRVLGRRR